MRYHKSEKTPKQHEELRIKGQLDNKELETQLKKYFDEGDLKNFYATAERVLRIKHGNPVVKVVLGDNGEVTDDRDDVSKKITEYFESVYKKTGDEPNVEDTWSAPPPAPTANTTFTNTEVRAAIKECNFNKGLGPDGFHGVILRPGIPNHTLTNNIVA